MERDQEIMNDESPLRRFGLLVAVAALIFLLGSQPFAQTVKPSPLPSPSAAPASDPQTTEVTVGNYDGPPTVETRPSKVHYVFPELAPNVTTPTPGCSSFELDLLSFRITRLSPRMPAADHR